MARIVDFMDGCDIDFPDDDIGLWDALVREGTGDIFWSANYGSGDITPPAHGLGMLVFETTRTNYYYLTKTITPTNELIVGIRFYVSSATTLDGYNDICPFLVFIDDGGNYAVTIAIDDISNLLKAYRGSSSGTLLATGSTPVTQDQWHYLEVYVSIDDSTGKVHVRLNQNDEIDFTGDTKPSTNTTILTMGLGAVRESTAGFNGFGGRVAYRDIIFIDPNGATYTDEWPRGAGVELINPTSDGDNTAWAFSAGSTREENVDDIASYGGTPDGTAGYIYSGTVGDRADFIFSDKSIDGSVLAVQLMANVEDEVAGADAMALYFRSGTVNYDQTQFVPSTSWTWHIDVLEQNPNTTADWTDSDIDDFEMGVVVK